jgi:PAS domain S-box-containing protein
MSSKPTYEELKQHVRELEEKVTTGQQIQHIVESTNNPIALVDRNFIYRYVNEPYSQALNKPLREIIGHSVPEMFGQNVFETAMEDHYKLCFAGEDVDYQFWFDLPGWGRRYMDVRYYPLREADGRITAAIVNAHDITEIKQLGMKLADNEERFRAFMDNTPATVYIKDENDRHIYANPEVLKSVGKKPDEVFGLTTRDLWPPAIADRLVELDRKVMDGDAPKITEEWSSIEKGEKRWRRDIKFPIKLKSGEKLLGGIAIDITKIKQIEKKLRELNRFERLLSYISTAFIDLPLEKLDKSITDALEQVGGLLRFDRCSLGSMTPDHKEMLVTHVWHRRPVSGVQESYFLAQYPWLLSPFITGRELLWSKSEGLPTGSEADIRLLEESGMQSFAGIPVFVEGKLTACLGFSSISEQIHWDSELTQRLNHLSRIFGNVLARKQTEEALLKSQEDFRDLAGKMLSVQESERRLLAREMHDDLTQRLAVLAIDIGKIEQHYQDIEDPFLETLRSVRESLVNISGDIHAISRQLHPSIIEDLGLVDAIRSECNNFTRREGIAVNYYTESVPSGIPADVAICIYRIVQEGFRNIAKHSGTTQLQMSLTGKDDSIRLTIKDEGAGFDPEEAEKKLGIGLVSMQERVRLIQGDISIASQPGKGTVINVRAPL